MHLSRPNDQNWELGIVVMFLADDVSLYGGQEKQITFVRPMIFE